MSSVDDVSAVISSWVPLKFHQAELKTHLAKKYRVYSVTWWLSSQRDPLARLALQDFYLLIMFPQNLSRCFGASNIPHFLFIYLFFVCFHGENNLLCTSQLAPIRHIPAKSLRLGGRSTCKHGTCCVHVCVHVCVSGVSWPSLSALPGPLCLPSLARARPRPWSRPARLLAP